MKAKSSSVRWGDFAAQSLASGAVSLTLVPDLGARVVSLRDLDSGREWLTSRRPPTASETQPWAAEDAVFDGPVSFGWDECLPTVAPSPDPMDPSAPALRDHGEQWGRFAPTRPNDDGTALLTEWPTSRWGYRFTRRLSFRDARTVLIEYGLENRSERPMPMLWSMHPCLRLEAGSKLDLPGVEAVRATWLNGMPLEAGTLSWPSAAAAPSAYGEPSQVDLAVVRPGSGWAAKYYATAPRAVRVTTPDGASLELDWDRSVAAALGIWVASGGWPLEGDAVEQIALEPTTSGHDDLASASAEGKARVVESGGQLQWWVTLRLSA
jgi:galactose mutarotase-like enzyme